MTNTRKYVLAGLIAIVVFACGFLLGVRRVPEAGKTIERHTITEKQTINITQKVDLAELTKLVNEQFAKLQKNVHRKSSTVTRPDGTTETTTEETDTSTAESGSRTASETARSSSSSTSILDEKLKVADSFKSVETVARARWSVGAFATYQPFGGTGFNLVPEQRLTVGVSLGHRLFGPLWGDLILTSSLAIGGGLRLVW